MLTFTFNALFELSLMVTPFTLNITYALSLFTGALPVTVSVTFAVNVIVSYCFWDAGETVKVNFAFLRLTVALAGVLVLFAK